MHRRSLLLAALLAPSLAARARAASGAPRVVATVSVLGDMVNQIAGKDVALTTIVGPDGDTEAYEPSAADARPAATLAAAPPLEPPAVRAGFQGLAAGGATSVSVVADWPNSAVLVLPRNTAPASRSRATGGESYAGKFSR